MQLHEVPFKGHYEHDGEVSQKLRLAEPENDDERAAVARKILGEPETVDDDGARRGYEFYYELGRHLGHGLFALKIAARDQSQNEHEVEIAAGLSMEGLNGGLEVEAGVPMWFISKRLHYKAVAGRPRPYPGASFGRLRFPDPDVLPQRRLFGAGAGA